MPETFQQNQIVILLGPTAVGKSELALALAKHFGATIINADSMQFYRHLEVGTAKPSKAVRSKQPHMLYDIAEPNDPISAAQYIDLADEAIAAVRNQGRLPLVVGGTGFYIRALLQGLVETGPVNEKIRLKINVLEKEKGLTFLYEQLKQVDSLAASRLAPADSVRIKRALEVFKSTGIPLSAWQQKHRRDTERYRSIKLGLQMDRDELYQRINERSQQMFDEGLLDEVVHFSAGMERGLGYPQARQVLDGRLSLSEAVQELAQETRRYAKRQMTWFRKEPGVQWFDVSGERHSQVLKEMIAAVNNALMEKQ